MKTRVGSVLRRLYSQIGFAWDQKVSHGFFLAIGRGFGPKTRAEKKNQGFLEPDFLIIRRVDYGIVKGFGVSKWFLWVQVCPIDPKTSS